MHLESIKFQVINNFNSDDVTLIIADDGSKDDTLELCKAWSKENEDLFCKVIILGDGKNRGTCQNFLLALNNVSDEYFYFLAGDDVYGFRNVRDAICELKQADLVSAMCPAFYLNKNGKYDIDNNYNQYKTVIAKGTSPKLFRRLFTIEGCIVEAAPAMYRSSMINDYIKEQIANCKLIEDQPMMYEFFRNKNLRMKYLEHSYVMYRINPESISHTQNSNVKKIVQRDLETLCNHYETYEKNLIYQFAIFARRQVIKGKKWFRYLFPSYLYLVIKQNIFNKKAKKIFKQCITVDAERGIKHLHYLEHKAQTFMSWYKQ